MMWPMVSLGQHSRCMGTLVFGYVFKREEPQAHTISLQFPRFIVAFEWYCTHLYHIVYIHIVYIIVSNL